MEFALVVSALVLGLAGSPHCMAMCAAPCALAVGHGGTAAKLSFHLARILGYAVAGALAASSVNAIGAMAQLSPVFKPLWSLLHAAALALGLWLAATGRQPRWLEELGRRGSRPDHLPVRWAAARAPVRAATVGGLWVAWPCGLLQSAILVAALANSAAGGAIVMTAFGIATAAGLILGPWAWRRMGAAGAAGGSAWGVRLAGLLLAAASGWALGHGVWKAVIDYCRV